MEEYGDFFPENPENVEELPNKAKFSCANIQLEMGRYDDAIEIYKMLNEKTPKWSCPWRHRGEAYWKKGELDNAVILPHIGSATKSARTGMATLLALVLALPGLIAGQKAIMDYLGVPAGPTRYPITPLDAADRRRLYAELEGLKGHIDGILDFQARRNVSVEDPLVRGYRDLFWFDFRDTAVRDAYLVDEVHQAIGARIVAERSRVITPIKKEIENGSVDMRGKYEETMEFIGKAAPVSIPG